MGLGLGLGVRYSLRLAHAAPEADLQQDLAEFFKEQVETRRKGEITVTIFHSGQLGADAAMIDGARSGIIDVAISGLNNFTGLVPDAGAFELPFIFSDRAFAYSILDGEIGQGVADQFAQHGLKMLGFPENGYRNMTNNRGPIREPADVSGLQMRVNNSRALSDMVVLLGATPQQIPVAELYTALETGVVDEQDHPIGIVLSFKFDETQRYLSLTQHAYSALAMVMNDRKFSGLTSRGAGARGAEDRDHGRRRSHRDAAQARRREGRRDDRRTGGERHGGQPRRRHGRLSGKGAPGLGLLRQGERRCGGDGDRRARLRRETSEAGRPRPGRPPGPWPHPVVWRGRSVGAMTAERGAAIPPASASTMMAAARRPIS